MATSTRLVALATLMLFVGCVAASRMAADPIVRVASAANAPSGTARAVPAPATPSAPVVDRDASPR